MKFIRHDNTWIWGHSTIAITNDGCGTVTVQFYNDEPNVAYLTSLSVHESKRKCGYGTKLVKEAEKIAKEYNATRIILSADKKSWVFDWYVRLGYKFCGFNLDFKDTVYILDKELS